jgi:hypothetical protein
MRTPVFELHILPMVRQIDREHMRQGAPEVAIDLWSYADVVAHADVILSRVGVDMPPAAWGGPWPPEWVAIFQRWKDTGFKRLEIGTGSYTRQAGTTSVRLKATGTFPAAGYNGWFQLDRLTDTERRYQLVFEKPDAVVAGDPAAFTITEKFPAPDTKTIIVTDSAGEHTVS